jgi:hypothetical protein
MIIFLLILNLYTDDRVGVRLPTRLSGMAAERFFG